jgi:hypothetical protein
VRLAQAGKCGEAILVGRSLSHSTAPKVNVNYVCFGSIAGPAGRKIRNWGAETKCCNKMLHPGVSLFRRFVKMCWFQRILQLLPYLIPTCVASSPQSFSKSSHRLVSSNASLLSATAVVRNFLKVQKLCRSHQDAPVDHTGRHALNMRRRVIEA